MTSSRENGPKPVIEGQEYSVPRASTPVDLHLDANEGSKPPADLLDRFVDAGVAVVHRYPKKDELEAELAGRLGIGARRVVATNGGDDAIDRICRAYLEPGRRILMPEPSFEMIARYAELAGAEVGRYRWESGPLPVERILADADESTTVIAVVTPNNPTGANASADALQRLSEGAPNALLLVDLAYAEFHEEDLMQSVLELPNAIAVRTLSKAWGLAGLRVGYAVGPEHLIRPLRAAGGPYPISGPSIFLAIRRLHEGEADMLRFVENVRSERRRLQESLDRLGLEPLPSGGNFVFAKARDGAHVRDAMAGMGIGIRAFPGHEILGSSVRITCPGNEADFQRLEHALETVFRPQALLFDLDGVLADVSSSYRRAILKTAADFGVELTTEDIAEAKAGGSANNDWVLTQRLLERGGVEADFEDVKQRFEEHYQGTTDSEGLWRTESLLCDRAFLDRLGGRFPLGIVTGRPRSDARRFLEHEGIEDLFETVVCMEDAPIKPDPAPVYAALERMGVERAWFFGDTPDDMVAARGARTLPVGVVAPGDDDGTIEQVLTRAGAAFVVERVEKIEELLP